MTPSKTLTSGGLRAVASRAPFLLGAAGLLFAACANAEALPSGALPGAISSELLRQPQRAQERQEARPQDDTPVLDVPVVGDQKLPDNPNVAFQLDAVVFSETAILDAQQLQEIARPTSAARWASPTCSS